VNDWQNRPIEPMAQPESTPTGRSCSWCDTPAAPDVAFCASCGASLAQREDLGDLSIPGVTTVDPALVPSGGALSPAAAARTRVGAINLAASISGISGAVGVGVVFLAADALKSRQGRNPQPENLGKPSEAAVTFAARLADADRRFVVPSTEDPGAGTLPPATTAAEAPPAEGKLPEMALAAAPATAPETIPDSGPGDPAAADPDAWWNRPGGGAVDDDGLVACPWCAARCAPDAPACDTCGASLAEPDELDGLQIPGVTTVDPALQRIGAAGGRKAPGSALGAVGRMGTIGMIMGAVSGMTPARTPKAERQAFDLDGPNPVIAAMAEQMRAEGVRAGAGARPPDDAGGGDAAGRGAGAADPVTPENDPWRDLPSQTQDQDR